MWEVQNNNQFKMNKLEWCSVALIIENKVTLILQEYIKISTIDYLDQIQVFQGGRIRPIQAFCQLFDVSLFRAIWWSVQFIESLEIRIDSPKIRFVEAKLGNNPKYSRMHVSARKCSLLASDESFLAKTPKPECNNFVRITFGFEIEIQANIQSRYGWCVSASFINFKCSRKSDIQECGFYGISIKSVFLERFLFHNSVIVWIMPIQYTRNYDVW